MHMYYTPVIAIAFKEELRRTSLSNAVASFDSVTEIQRPRFPKKKKKNPATESNFTVTSEVTLF